MNKNEEYCERIKKILVKIDSPEFTDRIYKSLEVSLRGLSKEAPKPAVDNRKRDASIFRLVESGARLVDVARKFGLSSTRIAGIHGKKLRKDRNITVFSGKKID